MALSPAEQALRDQQHFRDFTAARGLNPGPGPAPGGYNVTLPPKPSYNTASRLNRAPNMQASSFGLSAPPPPAAPSMADRLGQWASQQPKVDPMVEGLSRSAANPPPPSASAYGPPRPEYPAESYGPFQRGAGRTLSPAAQTWQQGIREPFTAPGGLPPGAPTGSAPAGMMKEAIRAPSVLTRGLQGLRMVGEALGPAGKVFAAEGASRGLERGIGGSLPPQTAAAMGIPQIPEDPGARTPADIYRQAQAANPAPPQQRAPAAPQTPRPESASGPVGPTIPVAPPMAAPAELPSAATTGAVNNAFSGGLNRPNIAPARQPVAMRPETGGLSSAEQMAQLQQDEARAEAARVPTRLRVGGLTDGQGVIVGQDGRTFQFDGQRYASFAPDGTLLSQRAAEAAPDAASVQSAMARAADDKQFMDRARAADDYRYNISRAMEYRDPLQRALMAKAAGDTYQTRVGGIPNAQTEAELEKQRLVNQGGLQQQEVQNQGALGVARQQGLTQRDINRMQADSRERSARIRAQAAQDAINAKNDLADRELMVQNAVDPDTGQSLGGQAVPRYAPRQQPQSPNEIRSQAQYLWANKPHLRDTIVERLKKAGIDPSFLNG